MSEIVNQSLRKIAGGAVIVFVGTVVGMVLAIGGRIIVARYVTQNEYGLYSLGLVLLNVFVVISTLGLQPALPRQIAFYRGKGDESKVRGLVVSSLQIVAVSSVFFSMVLFFASDLICARLFHTPELSTPLRIFCIAIPFFVLINVLTSIFRGFDRAEPSAYFQQSLRNALFLLLLIGVILLGLSFVGVVWAFVASIVLTLLAFIVYSVRKPPLCIRGESRTSSGPVAKGLLLFSLPLFAVALLGNVLMWIDTLVLGYFKTPADVGLYNAALPIVQFLPMVLTALFFLYVPLASQLYARGQEEEMKRSHVVLSKWIFSGTLPIFLVIVLFPEAVLNILFGSLYITAAPALQILSLGFFVHAILGLSSNTLITTGKTRFLMWSTLIAVIVSIILNIALVPLLGIVGAAIATASALALQSLLWSARLYSLYRIHPFTRNYLKPAAASLVLVLIIYALVKSLVAVIAPWLLLVLLVLFLGAYALSMLLTKSFDEEDMMMFLSMEQRLGMDLTPIKRIMRRFL